MGEALRRLRTEKGLAAKNMVTVIRRLYPKCDKPLLSKCENGDSYGVDIREDALEALYTEFAPERLKERRRKKNSGHKLTCRISARLADGGCLALQRYIRTDGYGTMQDWLTDTVRAYLKNKEATAHDV